MSIREFMGNHRNILRSQTITGAMTIDSHWGLEEKNTCTRHWQGIPAGEPVSIQDWYGCVLKAWGGSMRMFRMFININFYIWHWHYMTFFLKIYVHPHQLNSWAVRRLAGWWCDDSGLLAGPMVDDWWIKSTRCRWYHGNDTGTCPWVHLRM